MAFQAGIQTIGIISPNVIELATRMVTKYNLSLKGVAKPWARAICGFTSTGALRQKFPIDLTVFDGYRKWVGELRPKSGSEIGSFYIDSEPWERSVGVPLDIALSGQFDAYVNKVPGLVTASTVHENRLAASILQAGKTTAKTWDGVTLFGDHPMDTLRPSIGNNTNLLTSCTFGRANYSRAKKAMKQFKAPDGTTSLGLYLTHILHPTDLDEDVDALFYKSILATDSGSAAGQAAETNIYLNGGVRQPVEPISAPELDNEPGVWYAVGNVMPEIRGIEMQFTNDGQPEIVVLGDGSEHATKNNEILFRGKKFGNAGASFGPCIIRCEPS